MDDSRNIYILFSNFDSEALENAKCSGGCVVSKTLDAERRADHGRNTEYRLYPLSIESTTVGREDDFTKTKPRSKNIGTEVIPLNLAFSGCYDGSLRKFPNNFNSRKLKHFCFSKKLNHIPL